MPTPIKYVEPVTEPVPEPIKPRPLFEMEYVEPSTELPATKAQRPMFEMEYVEPDTEPVKPRPLKIGEPTILDVGNAAHTLPPSPGDIRKAVYDAYNTKVAQRVAQGMKGEEAKKAAKRDVDSAIAPRTGEFGTPKVSHPVVKAPKSIWDALHSQPLETTEEHQARIEAWHQTQSHRAYVAPGTEGDLARAQELTVLYPGLEADEILEYLKEGRSPKELVGTFVRGYKEGTKALSDAKGVVGIPDVPIPGTSEVGVFAGGVFAIGSLYDLLTTPENGYVPLYETTFATILRDMLLFERVVATTTRRALTYEVDEQGNAKDTSDPAYKIEQSLGLDKVGGSMFAGVIPAPRPFQGSTYVETEDRLYDQIVYDLAKGEFVSYSILPKYNADVTEEVADIVGLATSFFIPVFPVVKLPGLAKKVSNIRQAQVANATLHHFGLEKLGAKSTSPLMDAAEKLAEHAVKNPDAMPGQLRTKMQFTKAKHATKNMDNPITKVVAKEYFYEFLAHHTPDTKTIYINTTHVANEHTYRRALPEIQAYVKAKTAGKAIDPEQEAALFTQAAELYAGAWAPKHKGKAYELAIRDRSTIRYALDQRKLMVQELIDTAFRRKLLPDFSKPLSGNALSGRLFTKTQLEASGVLKAIEQELKNTSINDAIQSRVLMRSQALQSNNQLEKELAMTEAFNEWLDFSVHTHFAQKIDSVLLDTVKISVLAEKGTWDTADYLGRFRAVVDKLEKVRPDLKGMGPRGFLGFGPVHYVSTQLAYMAHADTGRLFHKALAELVIDTPSVLLPMLGERGWPKNTPALRKYYNAVLAEARAAQLAKTPFRPKKFGPADKALKKYIKTDEALKEMPEHIKATLYNSVTKRWGDMLTNWAHTQLYAHIPDSSDFTPVVNALQDITIPMIFDKTEQIALRKLATGASSGELGKMLQDLHVRDSNLAKWAGKSVLSIGRFLHGVTVSGMLGGISVLMPGTRFMGNNILTAPSIMWVTVGPKMAIGGTINATKEVVFKHLPRWVSLGKFTPKMAKPETVVFKSKTGITYTEGLLLKLENKHNIKDTQVSHEFRATLLDQIMRSAKLTADGSKAGWMRQAYRWMLQPNGRGLIGSIVTESDMLFRRGVFRAAIADGQSTEQAAHLARRALLDYAAISPWETKHISKYVLFWTFRRQMLLSTAQALVSKPERLKQLYIVSQALREDEDRLVFEQNQHIIRLFAGTSENGEAYLTGSMVPGLESVYQIANLMDLLSSMAPGNEMEPLTQSIKIGQEFIFSPITEMLGGALEFDAHSLTTRKPPKLPGRMSLAISMLPEDQRDYILQTYNISPVPSTGGKTGAIKWGVTEDNTGYELEFANIQGYYRFLATVYAMQTLGIYTGVTNWSLIAARTTGSPKGIDMGYLKEGSLPLYIIGAQTPLRVPSVYETRIKAMKKIEEELKTAAK